MTPDAPGLCAPQGPLEERRERGEAGPGSLYSVAPTSDRGDPFSSGVCKGALDLRARGTCLVGRAVVGFHFDECCLFGPLGYSPAPPLRPPLPPVPGRAVRQEWKGEPGGGGGGEPERKLN